MKYFLIIMSLVWSGISSIYAQERTPEPITKQVEKNVVLHIEEMNCQLCVYLVNKELRAVSGVISTKASMKDRKVKIVTTQDVDNQTLIQAVEKLHYSAKVM
ncbi:MULTISPECIES: heavy-metal-associated domain-containing protein [Mannheimia]|uniref:Heavy-metal-associated domain-containing protein n=1 Tax=Mannheimia pernigra TaxID=111844 RepID=A0A7H8UQX6_9PAST|nr:MULTISPECIES: heavy-metal-associated domain-containing protein [Mannheimia]QHB17000.1 copper chaperone [Mannheimia pernigra]QLB39691.1 heavy-metal-associated domain-containing protein [Mannheimia pernigra]QLB41811.1 heavy-metal-associated domain-containing protein [Mannheimia pernigra]QLB43927.1 heavy-metal-associated domain-containing protein [Mannheimia pernigra]QTM00963.1 copper chaperone [Mannheimia sp. ZY171111]